MNVKFACFAARHAMWAGPDQGNGRRAEPGPVSAAPGSRGHLTHSHHHPPHHRQGDQRPDCREPCPLHKVGSATGIIVRGARILATLAPSPTRSQFLRVCRPRPTPTPTLWRHTRRHAGTHTLCRDSASAPGAHPFNRPLVRFDEQDAFVIFDDVEVLRERLFLDGQSRPLQRHPEYRHRQNLTNQTTIRAVTKMEFAYGHATRMAEAIDEQDSRRPGNAWRAPVPPARWHERRPLLSAEHGREVVDGI